MSLTADSIRGDYRFAWWLRAADEAQLKAAVDRLAAKANVAAEEDAEATLRILLELMPQPGLVVFDDVESWQGIKRYVDVTGASDVIVTTMTPSVEGIEIPGLSASPTVVRFVAERAAISDADAEALIRAVDGLPLLLLHACQFIATNNSSVSEYFSLLEKPSTLFERWPYRPPDYEKPASRVIPLSLLRFSDEISDWRTWCNVLVTLAPTPVPLALLETIDDGAGKFVAAARKSFVLSVDRDSETVELPTLIRRVLIEMGVADVDAAVRERLWMAIESLAEKGSAAPGDWAYLAEHLAHLGADPKATGAVAGVASALGRTPLATAMWRQAYDGAVLEFPDVHHPKRVLLAEELGWALLKQGLHLEATEILSRELDLANTAGCISCRAPILHVLGHLAEVEWRPEMEALRTFIAAETAMKIGGHRDAELAKVLADIVSVGMRRLGELTARKAPPQDEIVELFSEAKRRAEELEELMRELSPLGSASVSAGELSRWNDVLERWRKSEHDLTADTTQRDDDSSRASSEGPPASLSVNFTLLVSRLLPRSPIPDEVIETYRHLRALEQEEASAASFGRALDADAVSLKTALEHQFGPKSHSIALADFLGMVAAHGVGDGQGAAAACLRFVSRATEVTRPDFLVPALVRGLAFDALKDGGRPFKEAHALLTRHAPWIATIPPVESFVWLASEGWSKETHIPPRKNVHRAIQSVCGLGASGPATAAGLAHGYAHGAHMDGRESLHFHRIAARIYEAFGVPTSAWGYALYCYAHRLLEVNRPDAAERRFREARRILTMVDGISPAVLHIDEHLASETAPYLPNE